MNADLATVLLLYRKLADRRVRYLLGAKAAASLRTDQIDELDCSGFVRYVMQRAGVTAFPDGSQIQWEWVRNRWRQLRQYSDVAYAKADPNRLFIAFAAERRDALGRRRLGHVWLVCMGKTMESYGSVGVGSRSWSHATLRKIVSGTYEVPLV